MIKHELTYFQNLKILYQQIHTKSKANCFHKCCKRRPQKFAKCHKYDERKNAV